MEYLSGVLTADNFLSLRAASGFPPIETHTVKKALAGSLFTVVASHEGYATGMVRVVGDGALIFLISDLLVHPQLRRRGVGSALVTRAMELVRASLPSGAAGRITLFSALDKEPFYHRLGFRSLPDESAGSGMYTYVRNITP